MGKIASENLKNALINQFDPEDARKASQSTALERFAYELQASSFVFGPPGTGWVSRGHAAGMRQGYSPAPPDSCHSFRSASAARNAVSSETSMKTGH